jgi:hypothetical protein
MLQVGMRIEVFSFSMFSLRPDFEVGTHFQHGEFRCGLPKLFMITIRWERSS